MSEVVHSHLRRLSEIVEPIDDKIAVKKDPNRPYVGLEHIGQRNSQLLGWAPSEKSVSVNSVFEEGDVLFGKLRPNLRKCVSAPFAGYCSTDILVLRARSGNDPRFAARMFQTEAVGAEAERTSMGTKMPRTSWKGLSQFLLPVPEPDHQSKIAEILDTLDAAIRGTEAVVAKLKAMKQGLLHDLLTRGIDTNGDLRPPQPEAPHLYKQTPLGWLPKEWDALPLGDYTQQDITYGIVQAGPHIDGGIPYIRTGDMSGDELVRDNMLCTSERIAHSYRRSEVRAGELVIAIRATLGKILPVPDNLDGANLTQGTARISPKASVNATCLMWAIRHRRGQDAIMKEVKGSTFMEISLGALRQVPIGMPTARDEQDRIARRLTSQDEAIMGEQKLLNKLHLQKSGLMDDLLTGRKPVKPLL